MLNLNPTYLKYEIRAFTHGWPFSRKRDFDSRLRSAGSNFSLHLIGQKRSRVLWNALEINRSVFYNLEQKGFLIILIRLIWGPKLVLFPIVFLVAAQPLLCYYRQHENVKRVTLTCAFCLSLLHQSHHRCWTVGCSLFYPSGTNVFLISSYCVY